MSFFFGWLFNFYITKVQDNLDMFKFLELKDVNCFLSYFPELKVHLP